ncbi:alanine racemase [Geminicoccus harenae]|uniref:alanine racemase n=2 Tax=Geminicoccus harenae TaxID=2498453 RepID=UPI001C97AC3C|nr:alanine racemase [Geminicoccus harenae]
MPHPTDGPANRDRPVLEVDLDAIVQNWRLMMRLAPGAEVAGVLKADGYGLGAAQVAAALAADGCRTFFVATTEEALALRRTQAEARIFLLGGPGRGAERELAEARILPALNDPSQLAHWRALAGRLGRKLPAAIQLDTGMHRLGFDRADLLDIDLAGIELVLVMSHLGVADEPAHPLNEAQLQAFEERRALLPPAPASLAASSGVLLGKRFRFDMVRPGIALYGAQPVADSPIDLRPVVRLVTSVIQVHEVEAPGAVGYGATHAVSRGMRIATLPIGYADGLLRAAGGKVSVNVAGVDVPVVGRISMDLVTIDVTALGGRVRPGTQVEVLGGPGAVERYAEAAGTIPYELLVRLGPRIERRYIGGTA